MIARCHWDDCPHGSECVHAKAPCCDGLGQVHHGHGALSYTTPCQNPECREARDRDFMTIDATGTWAECEREDEQR